MSSKFGYGCWQAPYWFIGPEEGGGANCVELATRLQMWPQNQAELRDPPNLRDLRQYHEAIGIAQWHRDSPRRQATWCRLLELLGQPEANNGPPRWVVEQVEQWEQIGWKRGFQRDYLAQPNEENLGRKVALLDVSPLPSPNGEIWLWGCLANQYPCLRSRRRFLNQILNGHSRIAHRLRTLQERIQNNPGPNMVFFYGLDVRLYQQAMQDIFHIGPPGPDRPIQHVEHHGTHVFWTYHPGNRQPGMNGGQYRTRVQESMEDHGCTPWNDQ